MAIVLDRAVIEDRRTIRTLFISGMYIISLKIRKNLYFKITVTLHKMFKRQRTCYCLNFQLA